MRICNPIFENLIENMIFQTSRYYRQDEQPAGVQREAKVEKVWMQTADPECDLWLIKEKFHDCHVDVNDNDNDSGHH